jgi:hypothetical protein
MPPERSLGPGWAWCHRDSPCVRAVPSSSEQHCSGAYDILPARRYAAKMDDADYVLDERGEPRPAGQNEWEQWFRTADRGVAADDLGEAGRVSTVFTGLDVNFEPGGPPLLWETFVQGGPFEDERRCYASRPAAIAGHAAMVALCRAAIPERPVEE